MAVYHGYAFSFVAQKQTKGLDFYTDICYYVKHIADGLYFVYKISILEHEMCVFGRVAHAIVNYCKRSQVQRLRHLR